MKDLYSEPFISYWPTPLSLNDIKECFRTAKPFAKKIHIKINSHKKISTEKESANTNIVKAFWNVFFSPLGFNA